MKLVTKMSASRAREFFLKPSSYFSFKLPEYFDFAKIIQLSDSLITGKNFLSEISEGGANSASKNDNVNYKIIHNKDGKYDWRSFELIHPILYVKLVNDICEPNAWKEIRNRIKELHSNEKIICCSIPGEANNKKADTKSNILRWWGEFEQRIISTSIEYSLMACTDIANCYPSIYTHSIAWALHTKEFAKEHRDLSYIGNLIDADIEQMRYSQTNGIPQGSVLMDFIAELVLGYGDELLSKRLQKEGLNDYKILRYRDDYRIFCNSSFDLEKILKCLSESLMELNFKLNASKTFTTKDLVTKSLKIDKIERFKRNNDIKNLIIQKQLFLIDEFGMKYPNSGSLEVFLTELFNDKILSMNKRPNNYEQVISIITDIMYNNPRTYPICTAILSHIFQFLDQEKIDKYISIIIKKFESLPNTIYLEIWLQRITIKNNRNYLFSEGSICEKIYNPQVQLWNSSWLRSNIKNQFNENLIINEDTIKDIPPYITKEEVDAFAIEYDM